MPWLHFLTLALERRQHGWRAWLLAAVFFGFCIGSRLLLDPWLEGAAFMAFYPAIMAATLFCGWRCGATVATTSLVLAWYFFLEPRGAFVINGWTTPISLLVFASVSMFQIATVEALARLVLLLQRRRTVQTEMFRELQHRVAGNAYEQYAAYRAGLSASPERIEG